MRGPPGARHRRLRRPGRRSRGRRSNHVRRLCPGIHRGGRDIPRRPGALGSGSGKGREPVIGEATKTTMGNWTLAYDSLEPQQEKLREVLTSTGNGYFCTRGAAEWADVDDVHYPGTYAHGCYNRETTIMGGQPVLNEDLVNLPNWLVLKLRIGGDEPITLKNVELLSYRHEVDFRNATVMRRLRFRDRRGRETRLASRRFVSMPDRHPPALDWPISAE